MSVQLPTLPQTWFEMLVKLKNGIFYLISDSLLFTVIFLYLVMSLMMDNSFTIDKLILSKMSLGKRYICHVNYTADLEAQCLFSISWAAAFKRFIICWGFLAPGVWQQIIEASGGFSEDVASPVGVQHSIILPRRKRKGSVCRAFL